MVQQYVLNLFLLGIREKMVTFIPTVFGILLALMRDMVQITMLAFSRTSAIQLTQQLS